ncbi:MAG: heme ABC transporter ATP-binding protein [Dietzia sp.]|jgi:iron complex transport system ATP-binding protein|uniref:Heme ABC transporter ATP-binding protein n=1 Tax=Dietzia cercidiphylli TaxID=498199 RepID=A0ABN2IG02_9ACTN|nr:MULTISPECIES: heme ABC transporter ATP-binding protein [Dietzia]MBC7274458.1 heme ABC transporter ATP-binding protein [Streptomyces sp.]MBB1042744.1 heme ABC transporter ATP-binding protein [Dietzia sp. Cai40]MBB1044677.1 heme ABC transporter ATP-binding protein [Dietzia sp. DQ11-44]MBB1047065.1 heme ABC transporter ATP-binding protein [Dietzia cercidiphylli]MBB1051344.1 heme ABC transporter ATP-binding protein [Dietzia sp. CW19]
MSVTGSRVPVLSAERVTVRIGGRTLLDAVDLEVYAGEVLALVGPNGAGKSTLLGVVAGDTDPDSGRTVLDGTDLHRWRLGDLARRRALLTQANSVAFPFTVREIVAMGRAPWAALPEGNDDEEIIEESLAATDTSSLRSRTFPTLSGGEKARASLSRALAQRAGVLLLDEPTAAVDLRHQEIVLELARTVADAGGAVVVVLHDLELAAAWSDRLVMISGGRIRAEGPPDRVLTAELVEEVYQQPVLVDRHPVTGDLLVTPDRRRFRTARTPAEPAFPATLGSALVKEFT